MLHKNRAKENTQQQQHNREQVNHTAHIVPSDRGKNQYHKNEKRTKDIKAEKYVEMPEGIKYLIWKTFNWKWPVHSAIQFNSGVCSRFFFVVVKHSFGHLKKWWRYKQYWSLPWRLCVHFISLLSSDSIAMTDLVQWELYACSGSCA